MKPARSAAQSVTLNRHIGSRLRTLREARGLRQDAMAAECRAWGMDWVQATVASVESGRRQLGLAELALLRMVLGVELAEIFDGGGSVRLTPTVTVDGSKLWAFFNGSAGQAEVSAAPAPMTESPIVAQNVAVSDCLWPGQRQQDHRSTQGRTSFQILTDAHADTLSDAERKAARRLGTFPLAVAAAARKRWGQSFTDERDKRVAAEAPTDATPRTLQALRGHITRRMIDDLEKEGIAGLQPARLGRKKGAPDAR